jgi:hypothetical protein
MSINPNTIVPPHRPVVPYVPKPKSRLRMWPWFGVLLLVIGVFGLGILWAAFGRQVGCILTQCDKNPVGEPAPWAEVVAAADEVALKAVPGALLETVEVEPVARWPKDWSVDKVLEAKYYYRVPTGERLYVNLQDTNPHATAKTSVPEIDPFWTTIEVHLLRADAAKRKSISGLNVSPRQAVSLTWEEALVEARNDDLQVSPTLRLGYIAQVFEPQGSSKGLAWTIRYLPVPADGPRKGPRVWPEFQSSSFMVDATTGEIVHRDMNAFSP